MSGKIGGETSSGYARFGVVTVLFAMVIGCLQTPAMVEVTSENYDQIIASPRLVILEFGAPWCRPCVKLLPILDRLANQYDGQIVIGKINVDQQEALMRQYDIRTLPTLCYLKKGKLIDTQTGRFSASSVRAKIDALLEAP